MTPYTTLTCNVTGATASVNISADQSRSDKAPEGFSNNCTLNVVDGETLENKAEIVCKLDADTNSILTRAGVTLYLS
jgi:hypothetical protein